MSHRPLVAAIFLLALASPSWATVARETNGTASGPIAAGSSFAASLGSGISDGDVVLVAANYLAGGKTITPPSGYALPSITYQCSYFSATADIDVFVHVWHTGDPTSSLTFSVSSGGNFTGGTWQTVAYKGADQTPILVATQHGTSSTMLTSNSLTPTSSTDMLLMIYGAITDNATYSAPSEGTINIQGPTGTGNGTQAVADVLLASGAATGNQTINISPSSFACGLQVAIAPPQPTPFPSPTPTTVPVTPTPTPTATPTPFPTTTPTATPTACAGPYQTIARRTPSGITSGNCPGAGTCDMGVPSGVHDGDFLILIFNWGFPINAEQAPNDNTQLWTLVKWSGPLSGISTEQWIWAKIWHTGDPTTVHFACSPACGGNVTGDWAMGTYTGVDSRLIFSVGSTIALPPSTTLVSPSLDGVHWPLPNTTKDMLFMIYGTKTAGDVFSAPSEGTIWAQGNSFFPTVGVDFLLSSASATGDQTIISSVSDNFAGMQASFAPACIGTGGNWLAP